MDIKKSEFGLRVVQLLESCTLIRKLVGAQCSSYTGNDWYQKWKYGDILWVKNIIKWVKVETVRVSLQIMNIIAHIFSKKTVLI